MYTNLVLSTISNLMSEVPQSISRKLRLRCRRREERGQSLRPCVSTDLVTHACFFDDRLSHTLLEYSTANSKRRKNIFDDYFNGVQIDWGGFWGWRRRQYIDFFLVLSWREHLRGDCYSSAVDLQLNRNCKFGNGDYLSILGSEESRIDPKHEFIRQ